MPFPRLLLIILLLLNLLAFAAGMGWLGTAQERGEPERLTNQINPERIELITREAFDRLPPSLPQAERTGQRTAVMQTPSITAPTAPTPQPVIEPDTPSPGASTTMAAAQPPAPPPSLQPEARICRAFEDLEESGVASVRSAVRASGSEIEVVSEMTTPPPAWWVRIPPTNAQTAERRVSALRAQGVTDLFIIRDPGPHQFAISLGLFRTEAGARRHHEDLRSRGIEGMEVSPREPARYRVELRGPESATQTLVRQLEAGLSGSASGACP